MLSDNYIVIIIGVLCVVSIVVLYYYFNREMGLAKLQIESMNEIIELSHNKMQEQIQQQFIPQQPQLQPYQHEEISQNYSEFPQNQQIIVDQEPVFINNEMNEETEENEIITAKSEPIHTIEFIKNGDDVGEKTETINPEPKPKTRRGRKKKTQDTTPQKENIENNEQPDEQ